MKKIIYSVMTAIGDLHAWLIRNKINIWRFYTWIGTMAILTIVQEWGVPRQVDVLIGVLKFALILLAIITILPSSDEVHVTGKHGRTCRTCAMWKKYFNPDTEEYFSDDCTGDGDRPACECYDPE